ncbi:hypothetical protein V8F20_005653 [Naviculisporaceae sp. PSN 640]
MLPSAICSARRNIPRHGGTVHESPMEFWVTLSSPPACVPAAHIHGSIIVGINVLYIVRITVFTWLRMYTSFSVHQTLWWDDWMNGHGGKLNFRDVPDDEFKILKKAFQNAQMVGWVSVIFAKLAILLLYIRIFDTKGTYRTALCSSCTNQYAIPPLASTINSISDILVLVIRWARCDGSR